MYCANCHVLSKDAWCPVCGSEDLRHPEPTDYCYLVEKEPIWTTALEDLLTDHGIPFVTQDVLGAGLAARIGPTLERKRFFVPYAYLEAAKALEKEFFASEFIFEE